jgi:hypothetical protein
MTNFNAIDINTYCALPIRIEISFVDDDGTEWFVLSEQLKGLLEHPEEIEYRQLLLDFGEYAIEFVEHDDGRSEEVELVSEAGLYMLLLVSKASAVQPFKSWVLDTVAPILTEDGQYLMGEERTVPVPSGYNLSHKDIWSGELNGPRDAIELAIRFLPDLRKTETTDWDVIKVIDGKPQIDQDAVARAMGKKTIPTAAARATN